MSKAIDKAAGAEREVIGEATRHSGQSYQWAGEVRHPTHSQDKAALTAPATPEAQRWQGFGTALKPAHEPVVVARKPLVGTVAANVQAYGTGALNIDGCRVEFESEADERESKDKNRHADFGTAPGGNEVYGDYSMVESKNYDPTGRWPANVVLDETAAELLDASVAPSTSRIGAPRASAAPGNGWGMTATGAALDDEGGPSRFFYVAKASRAERNAGLDGFEEYDGGAYANGDGMPGRTRIDGEWVETSLDRRVARANVHPTVKPIDLMRWLVRLVTPPEGTVLDPFLGSGTTGIAAALEGFEFVGVERDPDYLKIAEARIAFWQEHGDEGLRIVREREAGEARRQVIAEAGQLDLLGLALEPEA